MNALELRKDDFYLPTLEVLRELGGSATIEEIDERLIERFGFSQEQLDVTYDQSGSNVVTDKMSWARSYLKFPGYLDTGGRGVWVLTEAGRKAIGTSYEEIRDAIRTAKAKRRAEQLKQQALEAAKGGDDEDVTEDVDWTDELRAKLLGMPPDAFERLCQRLLREYGFTRVEVTGKSGDGGIDGHGVLRVNLLSFQVLFQSKRYKGSVSCGTVRDFRGAMQGRADKGLIITTGTFTAEARKEATRDGAPAIDLIDGNYLCELMKDKGLGVNIRQVVRDEVEIDESFFEEI